MKHISKHLPHYLSLLGIFIVGFLGFLIFSYDKGFQIAILASIAMSYVAWGIIHHHIHKDLYLAVVIEYIAVAILGFVIVFSIVFQG